jgi:hypothetical protein
MATTASDRGFAAPSGTHAAAAPAARPAPGLAVAALVLGIIAALTFWFWPVALPLSLLAIVFGGISRGRPGGRKFGGWGLGLGVAALVLMVGFIAVVASTL